MADLDAELAGRLSRLAAAVPVSAVHLDPVHRRAVEARQRIRMAWLTPLVVLMTATLAIGLLGIDPFAPGTTAVPTTRGGTPLVSDDPSNEPVAEPPGLMSTDRDNDFELVLESEKARYRPDEAIIVTASLAYTGEAKRIDVTTDASGPIQFGIREKVFGEIEVGGLSLLTCKTTTFTRGEPLSDPFQKSGGFSGDHPDAGMLRHWMEDPELRLPEGTWHVWAAASGPCMSAGPAFSVLAEIEIVVDDDPAATPGHPAPTEWADRPVYGGDDIGWAALQLKSEHPRYEAGAPVEISAWYWFMDGRPDLVASHFEPELALSIEQLDAVDPQSRVVIYDSACSDLGLVEGKEIHVPLGPHNVTEFSADSIPESFDSLFEDGALRLPVGRWRITASVAGMFARCGETGDRYEMSATIEIEVAASSD
jgi:hypothetical protein